MKRIIIRVTGRVQMVMFRDFTQRTARSLGLTGLVKNNEDGSVAVIAEGEEKTLNDFIGAIRKGSLLSRVDSVEVSEGPVTREFSSFKIIY